MSSQLLKRSLDIVNDSGEKNKSKVENSEDTDLILNLIPDKCKLLRKTKYKGRKVLQNELLHKRKATIEEVRKSIKDPNLLAKENIEKLLKLSSNSKALESSLAEKIFERANKKRYSVPEENKEENLESIFTEEEFKKFETEWFLS